MTARIRLERSEQEIVREALAYASRRVYDERGSAVVGELEDWLDQLLLRKGGPAPGTIVMPDEHLRVLRTALEAYSEALDHPSTEGSNRVRIARMRRIMRRADAQKRPWTRISNWLQGFFGGRSEG